MASAENRRILLASRPFGMPQDVNFRIESGPVPLIAEGEVLLRTLWLSLDPYMRGRMNEGASYAPGLPIGATMPGDVVARVEQSQHAGFAVGDEVLVYAGWQDYTVSDGVGMRKLDPAMAPVSTALGVLGMPGMTAWVGVTKIALPRRGETMVVAAASGAVGAVAGQIARMMGCRVVGIAGGPDKCGYVRDDLGFDAAIDHRSPTFAEDLRAACPQGIDIYFENVGGEVWQAVFPLLNNFARVPICGVIAEYNLTPGETSAVAPPGLMRALIVKRLMLSGFLVDDFADSTSEFLADMGAWLAQKAIRYREDVTDGLENAPLKFIGMLQGKNFGKTLIRVGQNSDL